MCPPDRANKGPDERDASEGAGNSTNADQEKNNVVGPLTDEELQVGGMDRVAAFIRTKRSKEALRKEKQRNKQQSSGKRQINIVVPDDDRSRATMRSAATAIEDEVTHRALELLLANEDLRALIVGAAARPELREIVDLIQQRPATPNALNAARLVITDPAIAELVDRATTTGRVREAIELAAANPEFVFFGRTAATGRSLCAGLARLLLRIRKVRHVENAP